MSPVATSPEDSLGTSNYRRVLTMWSPEIPLSVPLEYARPSRIVAQSPGATTPLVDTPTVFLGWIVQAGYSEFYWEAKARERVRIASEMADRLEEANLLSSRAREAERHPAFHALRGLGQTGLIVALQRLTGGQRPLWLNFLRVSVHDRPASEATTIAEAADVWREWGRRHGYLI